MNFTLFRLRYPICLLALGLCGCASYHALPLASRAGAASAGDIKINPARMPTQPLASHRFDPGNGLDVTETAMLAVANNPQLRLMRDDAGIAHAQSFAAGLLPDPQVTFAQDFVTGGSGGPGATSPFGLGLSYDVGSLLTYSSRTKAAQWNEKQVDLNLLWAEWQTVAQARVLFARVLSDRSTVKRLQTETAALVPLRAPIEAALAAGNLSYELANSGLNAAADAQQKLTTAQTALNQSEHDLRALLGLSTQAPLHLVGSADRPMPDAAQIQTALQQLPQRRPDLLALRAGYVSENQKLREQIVKQFPTLSVGFNRARDNAGVYTSGFSVALSLPLFNRNRGGVAVERATRQRLHDDYSARLLTSYNDVDRLCAQQALEQAALPATTAHAAQLDQSLQQAETAWRAHQLTLPTYLSLRSDALNADLQLITLRQNAAETGIALQTLLGGDWSDSAQAHIRSGTSPRLKMSEHLDETTRHATNP